MESPSLAPTEQEDEKMRKVWTLVVLSLIAVAMALRAFVGIVSGRHQGWYTPTVITIGLIGLTGTISEAANAGLTSWTAAMDANRCNIPRPRLCGARRAKRSWNQKASNAAPMPDWGTPLRRIAGSAEKIAGLPPGEGDTQADERADTPAHHGS